MSAGREFELKYGVADGRAVAVADALEAAGAAGDRLEARYFDTAAAALHESGIALRLRRSQQGWEQTLKAPGPQRWDRLEDSAPAAAGRAVGGVPEIDPERHEGSPAGRLLRRALVEAKGEPLIERFATVVDRLAVEIDDGSGSVEVAFDRGRVAAGDAFDDIREVEYEWKGGEKSLLLDLARRGIGEHGLWLSTPSKSERGERLASGRSVEATSTTRPRLDRSMRGDAVARAVVAACFEQIAANQSALADGHAGDEIVHQLRVGLRRARTAARELAGLDERLAALSMAALTEAFRLLGRDRDRRTVLPAIGEQLEAAGSPAPQLVDAEASADAVDPAATVRDAGFQLALLDLIGYIEQATPPPGEGAAAPLEPAAVREHLRRRLDRLRSRIRRASKRFDRLDDDAQHEVRKVLKRLRYLSEAVATLYAKRRVERYLKRLKPAQDALGEHVDLMVGLDVARAMEAAGHEGAAFNVGWLEGRRAHSAVACRKALREVADAEPFWA